LYLLDTDTASYIIKARSPAIREKLKTIPPDRVAVSVITRAELMYGLKRLPLQHQLHVAVRRFLMLIPVLPWDANAADHYAEIRHHLKNTGNLIGELDMMIAAHALALGATLVTNNVRHFQRIAAPLTLVNWVT
jgi:tRNA(fMet)-specific endonuclease VapC